MIYLVRMFLVSAISILVNLLYSFCHVSLSIVLVLIFLLGCGLFFFPFSFLDSARGGRVEVRRWTRNSLARLHSTREESQPFTSLMVSQSALPWVCLGLR